MDEKKTINPRTKGERDAFLDGYAQAIVAVKTNGLRSAQEWLITMVEVGHPDIASKMREALE